MLRRWIALGLLSLLASSHLAAAADQKTPPPLTVKLLESGQEPRRVLRHDLQPGAQRALVIDARTSTGTSFIPHDFPGLQFAKLQMRMQVDRQEAKAGQVRYGFTIIESKLLDGEAIAEAVRNAASDMVANCVGISGEATVDDRGRTVSSKMNLPKGISHDSEQVLRSMEGCMEDFCNPLPAEPVGLGAQWEVLTSIKADGVPFKQTSTYTLAELTNDGYAADVSVAQAVDMQATKFSYTTRVLGIPAVPSPTQRPTLSNVGSPDSLVYLVPGGQLMMTHRLPKVSYRISTR